MIGFKPHQKRKSMVQRKQSLKRHFSLFMASVFVISSLSGISNVFSAATVAPEDKLYYEIFSDTQSKLASKDIEFPLINEYPGFVRHNGFCNSSGQTDSQRKSYEYVLNTGYRTSKDKIAYPGQQIICCEHLSALPNKNGAIFKTADQIDTGAPLIHSYGLAFMMGNYAAHWDDWDKKIPHEPRIDILTHNKDFDAYTDPTKVNTGGNGGNTFVPDPPPKPEDQNFNTRLVFTTRTDQGKEPERHYLVAGQEKETKMGYMIFSVKPSATSPNLTINDLDFAEINKYVEHDDEAYAYTEVGHNQSKFVAVIPYFQYGGSVYTFPPSAFASLKEDGFSDEMINNPIYGIKSIDLSSAGAKIPNLHSSRSANSAYFLMRLTGDILKTDHPDDAWNSRNLIIKDEAPNGLTGPDIWKEKSEPFTYFFNQDLGEPFPYVAPATTTASNESPFSLARLLGFDSGEYFAADGARFLFRVPDAPGEAPAITLKVVNNRPATMEVVKKDKDTGARIWDSNMELTMYASNPDGSRSGRRIGLPQKMGDDGKFVFSSVDYQYTVGDTVWLVETVPPVAADGTRYEAEEFEVVASQDLVYSLTQLELTNQIHKYDFTIHKEGSKHEPIQGAAFEIYSDANCTRQVAYGESNQNGDVSIKLPAGTYYAKETYVPEPYKLDSKPFEITLGADMTTTSKTITNYPEYKVVVKKVDSITKYGVEDVSFKLLDSNKRPLKIDNVEVTGVSDGTGYVIWNVTGTKYLYTNSDETLYLQETNTNRGYFSNEELVPIDIKTTTPAESGITEGAYTFEVTNDAKFKARVKKTEVLEQRPATPAETEGISGITFEVYKRGSNKDTLIGTYETDSTGVFTTDDLYYGEYYAKEILPDDSIYVSSNEEIPLKIYQMNNLGQFADDNWSTYNLIQNKRKTGSISVYKKTNEGNFLPNVGFTLYHYDGKFNPSKFNIDDCTLVEHKFTDENGELLFKDLPLGNYWLVETETPTTYIGVNPMYITINTDNTDYQLGDLIGQHIQLEVINNRVPLTLRVIKKDAADSKPIQGAVFSLTLNGKSVSGTTNRDGILEFNNLTRGVTYTLKEESVPTPYKVDSTPMSITTDDTDILITKEVFNASKPATIQVYKYEKGNLDKPLKGAGFKLFLDGEQIGDIKYTDENGMIEWDNLTVSQNYSVQEVSAPEHYILNDGMRPIAFEEKENIFFCKLNVSNELKDYFVRLLKIDGDSKEKLAGAQFDLYKADKTTKLNTQPILTDSNGLTPSIEVPEPGTYYFKETKAPSNYQLDDRFVEVQAYPEGGEANIPIFENFEKPKYSIEITKIDSASKNVIAGTEFTLYDEQRNIVDVKVVPESGKVKFTVEELGTYYLRETGTPVGYEPNNTEYRFDISNDQAIYTQTVENTKKKHIIKVIKQDAENKAPLGEAVFEVFDSNYVKLGELTTTIPSGTGTFEVSGDGIFYLKEKQSPDGYEIISGYIQVKVDAETDVVEKTIYNEKLPEFWIKIYKKDRLDDSAIAGAVFDVFKSDKVTKVGTITTEAPNGFASIEVPEEGNYFLKETKAPKGYEPITDFIEVAVGRDNNIVEKTIYNEQEDKQEYWIKVYKQDVINKAPLADATFEVFTESNVSLGTFTTTLPNEEGTFKVQGPGVYYLKEIKSPYGYTLKQGFIPVTVSKTNNVVQTTIYNEQSDKEKYVLKVYKKDTTNKAPLEHAVIGVYDSNYKQIGTITTTIPDGSGYFEVDYPGQFYLKEIKAPKGYILKEGFIPVTVNSNTNVVETSIYNEKDEETVYNLITVYKVDQDNNPLKGVKVGLYDKKGKLLETGYTDSRGIVKFEDLDDGTYYVQEIEGLPGYEKITDQIKVAVSDGDSKKVTITNKEIVTEESAWISIKKYVEGSSTPLAGVEFTITGSNGYKSVHTTDNLGSIYINVPVGQYTVTETKGVQGYQMDSTPKSVQATAGTAANEVVFYNKPANGTLVITKVDSTSKEKLSGASFDIIDTATNANVRTVMTDSNGTANVTLPFGTYKVVETQAPTGYVLDVQNSITITISAENTLESITVENSKIPVVTKTPKTGTTPLSMGTVVPFLIAIVSAAILILLHRNEIKRLFNR